LGTKCKLRDVFWIIFRQQSANHEQIQCVSWFSIKLEINRDRCNEKICKIDYLK
jgi:hypothetical protein